MEILLKILLFVTILIGFRKLLTMLINYLSEKVADHKHAYINPVAYMQVTAETREIIFGCDCGKTTLKSVNMKTNDFSATKNRFFKENEEEFYKLLTNKGDRIIECEVLTSNTECDEINAKIIKVNEVPLRRIIAQHTGRSRPDGYHFALGVS